MADADRTRLRVTFDEDAERYDRARPGYPGAVRRPRRAGRHRPGPPRAGDRLRDWAGDRAAGRAGLRDRRGRARRRSGGRRAAARRRPGRHRHHHVAGGDEGFFDEVQDCYLRWDSATTPPGLRLPTAAEVPMRGDELDRSGRFGPVTLRRHEWELSYSAAAYLEILSTYSGHIAMTPDARDGLFDCIADLIERRHGGRISKRDLTELQVARAR